MRTKKTSETAADIAAIIKEAHKKLNKIATLSPKEQAKLVALLDKVKSTVTDFDLRKKQQLLETYKTEQKKLAKQGDNLAQKIAALESELK